MQTFLASNPSATPQQVLDELRMVSTFSALPVEDRMFLFVRAAFGPDAAKANAVAKHKAVLKGLILSVDAEAYQRRLIGVMEHHCAVAYPEQAKWFPLLLKQLYDEVRFAVFRLGGGHVARIHTHTHSLSYIHIHTYT